MKKQEKKGVITEEQLKKLQAIFGQQVVKKRLENGWLQDRFVFESNISQPTVSDVEKGKRNLQLLLMARFIKGLNTTFAVFFSDDDFNQLLK